MMEQQEILELTVYDFILINELAKIDLDVPSILVDYEHN